MTVLCCVVGCKTASLEVYTSENRWTVKAAKPRDGCRSAGDRLSVVKCAGLCLESGDGTRFGEITLVSILCCRAVKKHRWFRFCAVRLPKPTLQGKERIQNICLKIGFSIEI